MKKERKRNWHCVRGGEVIKSIYRGGLRLAMQMRRRRMLISILRAPISSGDEEIEARADAHYGFTSIFSFFPPFFYLATPRNRPSLSGALLSFSMANALTTFRERFAQLLPFHLHKYIFVQPSEPLPLHAQFVCDILI